MRKIVEFYRKKPRDFSIYLLVIILGVIIAGVVLFPTHFYDNWIWKYYWGPVVADACNGKAVFNGVSASEGYSIVSEITYGVILIFSLYVIYQLLK